MNELKIFENKQFGTIRAIEQNGEPWFVATDVCRALELGNSRQAMTRLDDDEKGVISTDTLGGEQKVSIVNEPGLYSLVLGSRKPEAKIFKRWITHEVIPSIRRNGGYISGQENMTPEELMAAALIMAQKTIENQKTRLSAMTVQNQIMQPKAEYFDELVDRNLLTNFRDTAKQLHTKQNDFVSFLLGKKYIYRDQSGKLLPYQRHVDNGLFELKECVNDKSGWKGTQTLITPKGRETFRLLFLGDM